MFQPRFLTRFINSPNPIPILSSIIPHILTFYLQTTTLLCVSWWGRKGRFCIEWSSRSVPRRHCCCILFIYCCSQYDNATIHCSHPIELFPLPPSIFTLRVYPPQLRPCCCGTSARILSVLFPLLSLCYFLHSNTKLLDHILNDYDYPLCHNGCC